MMNNTQKVINIHKQAGTKKDAIRVSCEADILAFLNTTISIDGTQIKLICVEGNQVCPLGSVIGYEESASTTTGYNCWHIANAATNLVEIDGVFYKKATVMQAMAVTDEFPAFLEGAAITHNEDGSWTIETDWGKSTGFPGKAYWVRYGTKEDGTPDANILTKSEKSYRDYIVCNDNGEDIGFLCEIDPA